MEWALHFFFLLFEVTSTYTKQRNSNACNWHLDMYFDAKMVNDIQIMYMFSEVPFLWLITVIIWTNKRFLFFSIISIYKYADFSDLDLTWYKSSDQGQIVIWDPKMLKVAPKQLFLIFWLKIKITVNYSWCTKLNAFFCATEPFSFVLIKHFTKTC